METDLRFLFNLLQIIDVVLSQKKDYCNCQFNSIEAQQKIDSSLFLLYHRLDTGEVATQTFKAAIPKVMKLLVAIILVEPQSSNPCCVTIALGVRASGNRTTCLPAVQHTIKKDYVQTWVILLDITVITQIIAEVKIWSPLWQLTEGANELQGGDLSQYPQLTASCGELFIAAQLCSWDVL